MRPTCDPPGSCRPHMGPVLAPWTLLSGYVSKRDPRNKHKTKDHNARNASGLFWDGDIHLTTTEVDRNNSSPLFKRLLLGQIYYSVALDIKKWQYQPYRRIDTYYRKTYWCRTVHSQIMGANLISRLSIFFFVFVFTRGQFWPSGIVIACVCVCVCVCMGVSLCVNHLLVRAIIRYPFKLGSPNLDQRCKRHWLRSVLFWGAIDLDLKGQI